MEHRENAIQALLRLIEYNAPPTAALGEHVARSVREEIAAQNRMMAEEVVDELSAAAIEEMDRRMKSMVEQARVAGELWTVKA